METESCPRCGGTGRVKRTFAVTPWRNWQERVKLVKLAKVGDRWLQIKSGRVVVIQGFTSYGDVELQHENGRTTKKFSSYFACEYTPESPPSASEGQS